MITVLQDLPANVIGLEASGKVTSDDYERTILPTIEKKQEEHEKVRLLYVLGENFEGYDAGAIWDDAKLAFKKPGSWERIAVVSDDDWIRRTVPLFSWMLPGDVKVFANSGLSEARTWVCN
jgi:hypothetical protein